LWGLDPKSGQDGFTLPQVLEAVSSLPPKTKKLEVDLGIGTASLIFSAQSSKPKTVNGGKKVKGKNRTPN